MEYNHVIFIVITIKAQASNGKMLSCKLYLLSLPYIVISARHDGSLASSLPVVGQTDAQRRIAPLAFSIKKRVSKQGRCTDDDDEREDVRGREKI